ncbi:hypothetical protein U1Q18_027988 [Sarracenia purpurea var. burkii]
MKKYQTRRVISNRLQDTAKLGKLRDKPSNRFISLVSDGTDEYEESFTSLPASNSKSQDLSLDSSSRRSIFAEVKALEDEVNILQGAPFNPARLVKLEARISHLKWLSPIQIVKVLNLKSDSGGEILVDGAKLNEYSRLRLVENRDYQLGVSKEPSGSEHQAFVDTLKPTLNPASGGRILVVMKENELKLKVKIESDANGENDLVDPESVGDESVEDDLDPDGQRMLSLPLDPVLEGSNHGSEHREVNEVTSEEDDEDEDSEEGNGTAEASDEDANEKEIPYGRTKIIENDQENLEVVAKGMPTDKAHTMVSVAV